MKEKLLNLLDDVLMFAGCLLATAAIIGGTWLVLQAAIPDAPRARATYSVVRVG